MKGNRSTDQLSGKGFYIVLLICVAVIGIAGYALLYSGGDSEDLNLKNPQTTPWTFPTVTATVAPTATQPVAATTAPAPTLPPTQAPTQAVATTAPTAAPTAKPVVEEPDSSSQEVASTAFFVKPVNAALPDVYEENELTYNATLGEWRFHGGIDILAEADTPVVAVADGEVASIDLDMLLGNIVTINHKGGLVSVYANLADSIAVTIGESVKSGDVIGTVGASASGEIVQASHLHFEMKQDGAYVNPLKYLPK